jgi:superfamily II DNA/RNA helicase
VSRRFTPARSARAPIQWADLPIRIVPTENLPGFEQLGLPASLLGALRRAGIQAPFPIQAATIPDILAGRDLLGRAATGSGKTLAFGLPLIARLDGTASAPHRPRGLVLVPTRELAMQVGDALAPLAASRGVRLKVVAGGMPIVKQINALDRGVDILVATPGRLVDLIERRSCSLADIEVTVLDEADHMADLGFLPVVRQLLDMTPGDGQRLLFSATLDGDVSTLVQRYLTDPAVHALSAATASVDTMAHHVFRARHDAKVDLAAEIAGRSGRTLMFVRTKHGADRLARQLGRLGVDTGVLHGGRSQAQRNRALLAFRDGSVPVLVATDVAARGIHVDDVSLVVHIDPPQSGKDYLHRSGRTARAGQSGLVVLLATPEQEREVRRMLNDVGVRAEHRDVAPGDDVIAAITGGRSPSGEAVVQHRAPRTSRPAHESARRPSARGQHNGRRGARQTQHADRRPRRASARG